MLARSSRGRAVALAALLLGHASVAAAQSVDAGLPHLRKQGTATQLVVDGAPFLALAGELGNSTASSVIGMRPMWATLKAMHLNTVLASEGVSVQVSAGVRECGSAEVRECGSAGVRNGNGFTRRRGATERTSTVRGVT